MFKLSKEYSMLDFKLNEDELAIDGVIFDKTEEVKK